LIFFFVKSKSKYNTIFSEKTNKALNRFGGGYQLPLFIKAGLSTKSPDIIGAGAGMSYLDFSC